MRSYTNSKPNSPRSNLGLFNEITPSNKKNLISHYRRNISEHYAEKIVIHVEFKIWQKNALSTEKENSIGKWTFRTMPKFSRGKKIYALASLGTLRSSECEQSWKWKDTKDEKNVPQLQIMREHVGESERPAYYPV